MKRVLHALLAALSLAAVAASGPLAVAPAWAQHYVDEAALDSLFAQLRVAPDATTAHQIDQRIWSYWTTPTDPALALRMSEVLTARASGDAMQTIQLLNRLVEDYPDYAEGWNQRATMYYIIGNFDASIADCEKVLELEPRHFGALAGRALMYLQLGKRTLALKDMTTALEIHPFLTERQLFPELQQDVTHI
jgi:tetratricopeptide (TPR) repeat protein